MKEINSSEFNDEVANGYCLVDFFANWCGPCKMLAPNLESAEALINKDNTGVKIKFLKLNVDDANELSQKYGVNTIPNVILFKDGNLVNRIIGYRSDSEIVEFLKNSL